MFVCLKERGRLSIRQMSAYILLATCLLFMTGCLSSRDFISTQEKFTHPKNPEGVHIVEKGDTLFSIAWTYGWDYHQLASANSISDPYVIYVDQRLEVANPGSYRSTKKVTPKPVSKKQIVKKKTPTKTVVSRTPKTSPKPISKPTSKAVSNTNKVWQWPANGMIIEKFSTRKPQNKGIDIAGKRGDPIKSSAAGKVVYAGKGLKGYGNLVIVQHDTQFLSAYAHASRLLVSEKERVKAGQVIAEVGSTGTNTIKLHFEIRRNGKPVDPLKYLPQR